MKKIIYSDLDGTLFDYNEKGSFVSDENITAINNWTKDNYFGIATGRNVLSINKIFKNTTLNINLPLVLTNGATIYDLKADKVIHTEPLPKDVVDESVAYMEGNPIAMLLLIGPKARYYVGKFDESIHKRPNFDFTEVNKDNINYDDIVKIDFILNPKDYLKLTGDIKKFKSFKQASLVPSSHRYVELISSKASKYNGILKALEYASINKFTTYTIGDFLNDYDMLKDADYSFAPSNAIDEIQELSTHVVKSNKEHAIKDMIDIINKHNY